MVVACMPKQCAGMAYHIRHTEGVCKPPKGAVSKRHGAERLGKRWRGRRHQVSERKLNGSEPLMTCRKDNSLAKPLDLCTDGKTVTDNCLLVTGQPALRRQQPCTGFCTERGKLLKQCAKQLSVKSGAQGCPRHTEVLESDGLTRSSGEVSVMEMERRG